MQRSIISIQSFEIFINMTESLIILILVHQNYYSNYSLFLWEYGTEALEHIFDISCQVIADFNFYEFYKIQKCVMYQDKISHAGLINTSRDWTSAVGKNLLYQLKYSYLIINLIFLGYVFDIDGTSLPHETIECLCTWPSDDDIKETICVGYDEAIGLANYLEINNCTISPIQQLTTEFSSDDINILETNDEENNQNQNLDDIKINLFVNLNFIKYC